MAETAQTTVLIKPIGGVAGDMFVGAAAALWPDLAAACLADLAALDLPETVRAGFETVSVNGFGAQKFRVETGEAAPPSGDYAAIIARLKSCLLPPEVLGEALAIFKRLGEAEAAIHDKPLEKVHFHELADWDSLVDIVAAASFIARAPAAAWRVDPLPLGGGMIQTSHGRVSAPAPATLRLLEGFDFVDDGFGGERVTPTGAAIVAHLATPGGAGALGRLAGMGFGAGDRRMAGIANLTQLVHFTAIGRAETDVVVELCFDIDDMTGEEIAVAADRLRARDGAKDLTLTAQIGKKGRASTMFRVLCAPSAAEDLIDAAFIETSTLGIRVEEVQRRILPRAAAADGGAKRVRRPGGELTAKAENDRLISGVSLTARRAEARRLEQAALAEGEPDE